MTLYNNEGEGNFPLDFYLFLRYTAGGRKGKMFGAARTICIILFLYLSLGYIGLTFQRGLDTQTNQPITFSETVRTLLFIP